MRRQPHVISETRAIRLLSSPLRQAILDWIVANGPATVAELGDRFGRAPDRLYYHVKLLQRAGLLVADEDLAANGRREARFDVAGRPMTMSYGAGSTHRRAVTRVVDAILREARKDFAREVRRGAAVTEGPRREVWGGRVEGLLSPADLDEVNQLLGRLAEVMQRPRRTGQRGRPFQVSWVLSPREGAHRTPAP